MGNLPEEVILEILLRLPVESLLRFRGISKSWLSLISNPHFADLHFQRSAVHNLRIVYFYSPETLSSKFQSLDLNASLHDDTALVSLRFPRSLPHYGLHIMGCCRGFLFLELDYDSQLVIWNPSTRVCKNITRICSKLSAFLYGFGYDSSTGDYLIVLASYNPNASVSNTEIHIFSVRTDSWKKLEGCFTHISPMVRPNRRTGSTVGSTLNGAIHWLASCVQEAGQDSSEPAIIALDLTEKRLREPVALPGDFEYEARELKVLGGFLSVIGMNNNTNPNQIEIWMMREYGVESSWSKQMCVCLADEFLDYYISPISFTKDGEVVALGGTRLMKLDEKGEVKEWSGVDLEGFDADPVVYSESLFCLPCDQQQENMQH
ncbi:hypothetical protein K1719_000120 [Acacia pycnantha]|nr:hypothetical protein K1719_000120 [Acacia pycnantha]